MKAKRFFYSVLLILFSLVLLADLGLWFLVPEAEAASANGPKGAFALPEGMTAPEGNSFPESASFPGSGERGDGTSRRRSRPAESDSDTEAVKAEEAPAVSPLKEWFSAKIAELQEFLPLSELTPVRETVRPYRLYILIGAALGMALCILRLVLLGKKIRQLEEQKDAPLSQRRVSLWPAMLLFLAALGLVVFLFPVNEEEEKADGALADLHVLSGTAEEKTLTSFIQSTGYLEEQEAVSVNIPASITVSSVCVKNGDTVTAGQIVAKADKTSVMQAIASVHEALEDIDSQLQKAHEAKSATTLSAPVAGTVKTVYAQVGETVQDVMNDHGALMLLSLDGRMAVQISASDDLFMGSAVIVTLSDGTELTGEVSFLEEGIATVTVVDRGYAMGEQVSVKSEKGDLLGSGPLYVHKALNITGYLGTVSRIYRTEGSTVYGGTAVIELSDTADLSEYQSLLQQRSEYEAELKTLFELYESGYVHAPCGGVIEGLSDALAYLSVSDMVTGLTVRHLASGPADAEPEEYVHYVGEVLENAGGLLSLNIGANPVSVSSYTALPALPAATMTGTYTIPGSSPIYLLSSGWNTISASEILPGDRLLFTFDANGSLVWVIVEHTGASATPMPTPTPTPTPAPTPGPSESAAPAEGPSKPGESAAPSGSPSQGDRPGGGRISIRVPSGKDGGAASSKKAAYAIAEQELCTVTPQEKMLIRVSVDELDVLSLSLGQEADLYLDALSTTDLTAAVTKIDPEGENSGGNTKYAVTLALDRQPQLYPGMNGTVCFPRSEGQAVLTVPLAALTEEGNRTVVFTAYDEEKDELLSPVTVQTGVSDGTYVEILSGLDPGDTYYYRYADSISYITE